MKRIELTESRVTTAYVIAIAADLLQLPLSAVSATGFFTIPSEFADFFFDCVVMVILWRCLGFHWLLLPAMAGETFPGLELLPTWTASVALLVKMRRSEEAEEAAAYAGSQSTGFNGPMSIPRPLPLEPDTSIQSRLRMLNALFEQNLISPKEYESKRQEILAEL